MYSSEEIEKLIGPVPEESHEFTPVASLSALYAVGKALAQMHLIAEDDEGYAGSEYEVENLAALNKVKNYMSI